MKQLLTILLLFPLFISCSSDDDDKKEEGLTDTQKEVFMVGQWRAHAMNGGGLISRLYIFYSDKSFRKYNIVGAGKIKLADEPINNIIGEYNVTNGRLSLGGNGSYLLEIIDENTVTFGSKYTRDTTEYTL